VSKRLSREIQSDVSSSDLGDQQRADSEDYYEQMSLYVMPGTTRAALLSCGGVVEACLAVARKELRKTFAIVRPPGHHAEPDEHMGFCFFNNVAVAARVVQQLTPLKRIMILDWFVYKLLQVDISNLYFQGMFTMVCCCRYLAANQVRLIHSL
jgi:acetoin utilization deacetylase AcuC-like enzyme